MPTKNGGPDPPSPFVSQCQHFPNPPSPFCQPCQHLPLPPPFCSVSFVSMFNTTLSLNNQLFGWRKKYIWTNVLQCQGDFIDYLCFCSFQGICISDIIIPALSANVSICLTPPSSLFQPMSAFFKPHSPPFGRWQNFWTATSGPRFVIKHSLCFNHARTLCKVVI